MSEIKFGQRVNVDPDATYTALGGGTTPTFLFTTHDPKGEYVVKRGPDTDGDLLIVQLVGDRAGIRLWAAERFVTPYVEHDAGEETPPSGGVSRETALAVLGRAWYIGSAGEEHLPSQSDIFTGAAPADVVSALAAWGEATVRLVRILDERSADR